MPSFVSSNGLSTWQASKVEQKCRMEAELSSLDSQLERAKLAQGARAQRLQAAGVEDSAAGKTPNITRVLFSHDGDEHDRCHSDVPAGPKSSSSEGGPKMDLSWTPQLDLSHDEKKVATNVYPKPCPQFLG